MRIKELDAFRGIAAMLVVLFHYTTMYNKIYKTSSIVDIYWGWLGVPFFFILSGFVITLTVEKYKNPLEFFKNRFLRLYPTYWICLFISVVVLCTSGLNRTNVDAIDIIMNFTMWQQFLEFKHVDGSYWSLLPELLFYFHMGFLILFKKKQKYIYYNFVILLLCLIHLFYPIKIFWRILNLYYILLFLIGISFYRIYRGEKKLSNHILILVNLSLSLFMYNMSHPSETIPYYGFTFTIIICLFYLFIYNKFLWLGKSKVLVFLGTISYPLYLIHSRLGFTVIYNLDKFNFPHNFSILFSIFFSVFIAFLIQYKIENRFRRFITQKIDYAHSLYKRRVSS